MFLKSSCSVVQSQFSYFNVFIFYFNLKRLLSGSWIYNYLCNQCLSPLTLWVRILLRLGVLDTTLCYNICQLLATGQWFSPGTQVSSTNKIERHDIAEILLKVAINTITLTPNPILMSTEVNIRNQVFYRF